MKLTSLIERSPKTRSQIIQEVGCSQSYFSLMESGQRQVGAGVVYAMARALGVPPSRLRPDLADLAEKFSSVDISSCNKSADGDLDIQPPDGKTQSQVAS